MTLDVLCRRRDVCGPCRDRGALGDAFRRMAAHQHGTPAEGWECPHGVPWGEKPAKPAPIHRSPGEQSELIATHCDACPHQALLEHDTPACRLLKGCGGKAGPCRSKFITMLVRGKCPAEKF